MYQSPSTMIMLSNNPKTQSLKVTSVNLLSVHGTVFSASFSWAVVLVWQCSLTYLWLADDSALLSVTLIFLPVLKAIKACSTHGEGRRAGRQQQKHTGTFQAPLMTHFPITHW